MAAQEDLEGHSAGSIFAFQRIEDASSESPPQLPHFVEPVQAVEPGPAWCIPKAGSAYSGWAKEGYVHQHETGTSSSASELMVLASTA